VRAARALTAHACGAGVCQHQERSAGGRAAAPPLPAPAQPAAGAPGTAVHPRAYALRPATGAMSPPSAATLRCRPGLARCRVDSLHHRRERCRGRSPALQRRALACAPVRACATSPAPRRSAERQLQEEAARVRLNLHPRLFRWWSCRARSPRRRCGCLRACLGCAWSPLAATAPSRGCWAAWRTWAASARRRGCPGARRRWACCRWAPVRPSGRPQWYSRVAWGWEGGGGGCPGGRRRWACCPLGTGVLWR